MSTEPVHVMVVGAGPSGLTLTHELLRRGVPVRLVDAAAGGGAPPPAPGPPPPPPPNNHPTGIQTARPAATPTEP
ncbi:FAD-dependent monooxygenase, partial [Kitasatospora phosalacinea]|uniref:FAD-dependent monooxygenase n=1 Tax=Kitasatospora phosalacinea TaxID=2065 RepID=UPI003650F0EB